MAKGLLEKKKTGFKRLVSWNLKLQLHETKTLILQGKKRHGAYAKFQATTIFCLNFSARIFRVRLVSV